MIKKIAILGVFVTMALIVSYIETILPFQTDLPGIKLGLANIVIVMVLHYMGEKEAIVVSSARILLAGFLFGNLSTILYSLAGAAVSLLAMILLLKTKRCSVYGISMAGGVFHNVGQLLVAAATIQNINLAYYLPVLLITGLITGFVIGLLAAEIIKRIPGKNIGL